MKNDDWKKQLQAEGLAENDADAGVYKTVFNALEREPDYSLPTQFADSVMVKINLRHQKSSSADSIFLAIGITLLLIVAIVGAALSGFSPDWGIYKFFSNYLWLIIFGGVLVAIINWVDHRIVRRDFSV
jgi:hypothetical protein